MNSAAEVSRLVTEWKAAGCSKTEIVVKTAEACMGWPYVWGADGQYCTVAYRKQFAARSSCPDGEKEQIRKTCQRLRDSSPKSTCDGCKFYPGGEVTRIFDCRGFTRWVLKQVGVPLDGAGATSQYNANSNWTAKGKIADMPRDKICCVFMYNKSTDKMSHTGLYVGNGRIIHCSGTVKEDSISNKKWTNYGVPKGLDGEIPVSYPTLRRGSAGEYVTLLQTKLIQLNYNVGDTGADGKFGAKTEAAVKTFQRDRDLTADGIVGPATWDALLSGSTVLYTVTIKHIGKSAAEEIVRKYGGTMTREGDG